MEALQPLLDAVSRLAPLQVLVEAMRAGGPLPQDPDLRLGLPNLSLPRAARVPVVAVLARRVSGRVIVLVDQDDRAQFWAQELARWLNRPRPLPAWVSGEEPEGQWARVQALLALFAPSEGAGPSLPVVVSARGLWTFAPRRDGFLRGMRLVRVGGEVPLWRLVRHLEASGYQPVSTVVAVGQFARRGGLLDVWPPTTERPVRVDFFGDEVERIRFFDPETQRTVAPGPERVWLPPLTWPDGQRGRLLLEVVPEPWWVLVEDAEALQQVWERLERLVAAGEGDEGVAPAQLAWSWPALLERLRGRALALGPVRQGPASQGLAAYFQPLPRFGGRLKAWVYYTTGLMRQAARVQVASRQRSRLEEYWQQQGAHPRPEFLPGPVAEGFALLPRPAEGTGFPPGTWVLMTDAEIFGWAPPRPARGGPVRVRPPEQAFGDLQVGEYVVHVDHGIGRFRGLVRRTLEGVTQEYLLVEYAEGDQLYVPVDQADRLTRYVGPEGHQPELTRLGSGQWQQVRARARQAAEAAARELLELYARRQMARGHAFSPDTDWQRELEALFPYELTEDQRRAIEAVKRDMERPQPMDRLICGDAGFGKTEVALRAAFKAVMDGKQVAVLVPTTVLAQQHFETFRQRMAPFPVVVEMLSRFRSSREQERILQALAQGGVDIIIGTHRLLSEDVRFKDLGLVIIDEEHRFGVLQKEHFKRLRTQVDVLSLSATPIPRTLYMALTGVRDISIIRTPPRYRKPVITHVGPYDPGLVRQALRQELARGGQVFYVHNRVQSIWSAARRVQELVPEAQVEVAHGQMAEEELARVMARFARGEVDVLVCTTIIESGLDYPRANTLVVEHAEQLGLAQLYQLRGRVGRGHQQGFAYFFWSPTYTPPPEARERLQLLAEHTELGSGFTLALHDLELRGAGDLLGLRQHGHAVAVGYHLYTQLLAESVQRLKREQGLEVGEEQPELTRWTRPPVRLDLPLPATLPEAYIPDPGLRLALYRRLAVATREEEVAALARELEDRFGPLPEPARRLVDLVRIKVLAQQAGVLSVGATRREVVIRFPENREQPLPPMPQPVVTGRHTYRLPRDLEGHWVQRVMDVLRQYLEEQRLDA